MVRYFNFYTYQKITSCWKRRGPQVCDTYFSGLASLYFTSDDDRRKEYDWVMMQQIFLDRRISVLLKSQSTLYMCLNSNSSPGNDVYAGQSPIFDHIFTNQHFLSHKICDVQNIVILVIQSLLVKRFISFKRVIFLVLNEI